MIKVYFLSVNEVAFSSCRMNNVKETVLCNTKIHFKQFENDIIEMLDSMHQEYRRKDTSEHICIERLPKEMSEFFLIPRDSISNRNFIVSLVDTYSHHRQMKPKFLLLILELLTKQKLPIPPYIMKTFKVTNIIMVRIIHLCS